MSRESPEEAKERAKEACQKRLASAIEAGELEPLREAIDAADLAGCSTSLLKQARSRRDALRKAARRLERQAAGAQCEEEARRQREQRAAEAAAEEEKARVAAAEERAAARQEPQYQSLFRSSRRRIVRPCGMKLRKNVQISMATLTGMRI